MTESVDERPTSEQVPPPGVGTEAIPAHVWRLAAVVVFGAFMSTLDASLVGIGLRTIAVDLGAPLATTQWVVTAYLVALAVSLPACGWACRRFGARRIWIGSMAAFTLASALCAVAPSVGLLVVFRVLQGLAAGLLVPAGQTIIGRAAGPHRLGRVMSTLGIAVICAPALGPTVGGLMLEYLHWGWLFGINVPLGVVAVALALRILPPDEPAERTSIDVPGIVALGGGISLIVYGVGEASTSGSLLHPTAWLPLVIGVGALAVYCWLLTRPRTHIIDVRLYRNRVFVTASVAIFADGALLFGSMLILPLWFQAQGQSIIGTGLSLIVFGVGGIISMPIGGRLTDRYGGDLIGVAGAVGALAATIPFVFVDGSTNAVVVQTLLLVRGIAIGLLAMPVFTVAYASVAHEQLPDATSLANIAQRVGGAIGSAVVTIAVARSGFAAGTWWLVVAAAIAVVTTVVLVRARRRARDARHQSDGRQGLPVHGEPVVAARARDRRNHPRA